MRLGDEVHLFEIGHNVADCGWAEVQTAFAGYHTAADGLADKNVILDYCKKNGPLALGQGKGHDRSHIGVLALCTVECQAQKI